MPIGAELAAMGGAEVLGSVLAPKAPSVPQLPGTAAAADRARFGINKMSRTLDPLAYSTLMRIMRNPQAATYMARAKTAGRKMTQEGNRLYQAAFDPQDALRKQLEQQTMDRANVLNSQYGLGSSPYGAGVAGEDLNNFNIDWQNAQLQRELSASGAIGQDWSAGAAAPYTAAQTIYGDQNRALSQYGDITNMPISDYLAYVGQGNQNAATNQNAFAMNQAAAGNTAANLFPFLYYGTQGFGSPGGTSSASSSFGSPYGDITNTGSVSWGG